MNKKFNDAKNNSYNNEGFDEIDLRSFFDIFIRNKIIVSSFAVGGFVFSCIYALSIAPVWEGKFQMLLEQKNKSESTFSAISSGIDLLNEAGLGGILGKKNNDLQSELEIIQSPYILNSVFEFVKSEKLKSGEDVKNLRFDDWRTGNIMARFKGNTNVMQFSYKDTDKKMIIPILNMITKEYQNYSLSGNKQAFEKQTKFLKNQIKIHKIKTKNSYNRLDNYALQNNLTVKVQDGVARLTQEYLQIKTRDEIFLIKQLLDLYDSNPDLKTIIFSLPKDNPLVSNFVTQYRNIDSLNGEIAKLKTKYKANVYPLKDFLMEKEILAEILKKDVFTFLENRLIQLENNLKKGENTNMKILKFKELTRNSERNEKILAALEGIYQQISIEESKYLEPWQVISKPIVSNRAVYPNKRFIAIAGTLFSLLIGTLLSILRELKSGTLYNRYDITKNLPYDFIKELDVNNNISIGNLARNLELRSKEKLKKDEKINFFPVGTIDSKKVEMIIDNLNKSIDNDLFVNYDSKLKDIETTMNILILEKSKITKNQISDLLEDVNIMNIKIEGFILIE